ncbi:FecR domain-containing protein [Methylovorus menthalis]|uniref:FecR domain-containing protein n=1 Tax=Methylovorus menthalis TaxID=1002227 RepID=UPI001E37CB81|nr:FecR domain-containing protein [Methylovorus menthalis]MCB4811529.1 FecR domain-containing protein [Methylovorus menthalis]
MEALVDNNHIAANPSYATLQQAAEWFAMLHAGEFDTEERAALQAWLEQDNAHRLAWQQVENVMRKFQHMGDDAARQTLHTLSQGRRRVVKSILALCLISAGGWSIARQPAVQQWSGILMAQHTTRIGERRRMQLADGSILWLNTASAVNIDYSASQRHIQLVAGEVWVQTATDTMQPGRPFIVSTRHGQLQALGTRFNVLDDGQRSHVAVFEGAVAIRLQQADQPGLIVQAGEQSSFDGISIQPAHEADPAMESWTRGMLVADNLPLPEFVARLERYRRGHLGYDPALSHLRIVGAFPLQDTDRALHLLEQTLPVRVHRLLPWWVTLEST